jgi:hypothetical protein
MQIGVVHFFSAAKRVYYSCGEDGVATLLTGPYEDYFYQDGVRQKAYQLVEFEGNYYFISDYNKLMKNTSIFLTEKFVEDHTYPNGDPMLPGRYEFDADGKMILLNGPKGDYFYVNGIIEKAYKLVEFEGNYYFISDRNKLMKNGSIYLTDVFTSAFGLPAGKYTFDADGKMILG